MGLVLPQQIEMCWCNSNKEYYTNKGYIYTKRFDKFKVNVEDLSINSHAIVEIICDNCHEHIYREYRDYARGYCVKKLGKYFCGRCYLTEMKNHGITPTAYWKYTENMLKELQAYINKYHTLIDMHKNKNGVRINAACFAHGYKKEELCDMLGYSYQQLMCRYYPIGYFEDYDKYVYEVINLAKKLNRIPKQSEIMRNFQIGQPTIYKHGGINHVKDILKDLYPSNLKDDTGFYNKSNYEYMVAQFLIHNNIYFTREDHPFPSPYHKLRSDFCIKDKCGDNVHIEVWGFYVNSDTSKRMKLYKAKRKLKERLYKEFNIKMISIDGSMLNGTYDKIQENLIKLLGQYLNGALTGLRKELLISPKGLSDAELFSRIMVYTDDSRFAPYEEYLLRMSPSLHNELVKRFGNLNGFAKQFDILTRSKVGLWDKRLVFKIMKHMYAEYGRLLRREEVRLQVPSDPMLCGFINGVKIVYPSIIDAYLDFYNTLVTSFIPLNTFDLDYLCLIISRRYLGRISTEERINFAKEILDLNSNILEITRKNEDYTA